MEDWLSQASDPGTPSGQLRHLFEQSEKLSPRHLEHHFYVPIEQKQQAPRMNQVRAALAANPSTPSDVVLELLSDYPSEAMNNAALSLALLEYPDFWLRLDKSRRSRVLKVATLTADELRQICPDEDTIRQLSTELLEHPATPDDFFSHLTVRDDRNWRALVAHPRAPAWRLEQALEHHDLEVRQGASEHPRAPAGHRARLQRAGATDRMDVPQREPAALPEEELLFLAGRGHLAKLLVALNPAAHARVLERLLPCPAEIMLAMVRSPNITPQLLDRIAGEYRQRDRKPTPGPLKGELPAVASPVDLACCAVARHPSTPRTTLERLADHLSEAVRAAVAQHPALPRRCLTDLGLDDHAVVVLEALRNPALSSEVIDVIVRYRPPTLLARLAARHPNASRSALRELLRDPDDTVRVDRPPAARRARQTALRSSRIVQVTRRARALARDVAPALLLARKQPRAVNGSQRAGSGVMLPRCPPTRG